MSTSKNSYSEKNRFKDNFSFNISLRLGRIDPNVKYNKERGMGICLNCKCDKKDTNVKGSRKPQTGKIKDLNNFISDRTKKPNKFDRFETSSRKWVIGKKNDFDTS